jgi:prepilin-type N-terminal cleavage/methylation domain-containing protein
VRPSPSPTARRAGFTLIELLVCVVVIGLLAAIAGPKFANTKGKANLAAIKSDLHNLVAAQENYFHAHQAYAPTPALLDAPGSPGVQLTVVDATASGWAATSQHPASVPITCAVFYGRATPPAPATVEGVIACQ